MPPFCEKCGRPLVCLVCFNERLHPNQESQPETFFKCWNCNHIFNDFTTDSKGGIFCPRCGVGNEKGWGKQFKYWFKTHWRNIDQ